MTNKISLQRYIYVCHASALARGGEKLLKIVICLVVAAFSLQWMIMWIIYAKGKFSVYQKVTSKLSIGTGNLETDFPLNTIKGKICTQTIIEEFENHTKTIEFSIKPKVIMLTIGL